MTTGLSRFRKWRLAALVLPVLLVVAWQVAVSAGWWPRSLIASPCDVAICVKDLVISGELFAHSRVSLLRLLGGFGIGGLCGVVIGTFIGTYSLARATIAPTLEALIPIPPPAWIPLLIILLGIGESSKLGLIAIGAFGVVYANTVQGILGADRRLVEVASLYEKPRTDLIIFVLLPSAAHNIFTGLRVALGLSWILLVAAEMVAARMVSSAARLEGLGLGWLIFDARRFGRPDEMIAGMLAIGMLGKFSDFMMAVVQSRFLAWRTSFSGV